MDRLDALEVFLQVAATGSFAAAADRLRVDPATVTKRVAYLEALLERRLFQRSTRRVTLTAEGEALLSQAADLQDRAQAFFAKEGRAAISGVVRIRCSHSLASFGLAALLERFSLEHPAVQVELQASEKLRPIVEIGADLPSQALWRIASAPAAACLWPRKRIGATDRFQCVRRTGRNCGSCRSHTKKHGRRTALKLKLRRKMRRCATAMPGLLIKPLCEEQAWLGSRLLSCARIWQQGDSWRFSLKQRQRFRFGR